MPPETTSPPTPNDQLPVSQPAPAVIDIPEPSQTPPTPPPPDPTAESSQGKLNPKLIMLILLFIVCVVSAFLVGKHGQHVVYRLPPAPPITLPPQAVVVADCVAGLGKQYVIPKDIPVGPIYDVKNSKVIAVEYNYKAVDLFINPDRLSNTVIPLTKNYQIDHFTTTIGDLKGGSAQDAQNVPVHLTMYVVSKAEANNIKCPSSKAD
jgi:hypothetical protein